MYEEGTEVNMNRLSFRCFCLTTCLVSAMAFQATNLRLARCETPGSAPSEVAPGELEYHKACARCHGNAGKGRERTAATSTEKLTDLTILTKKNAGVFPERRVLRIIHNTEPIAAHGPREAPVWGKQFSLRVNVTRGGSGPPGSSGQVDYRVKQLVQYLKSIQER